ncbi:MAG: hypothetical protein AAGB31_07505, partial [Bdellovibrio sp.]
GLMKAKIFLISLGVIFSASWSFADQMGPDGDKFYEEAAHFENACRNTPCKAPYAMTILYNQKTRLNKLNPATRDQLKNVVIDQAQVWRDTILEGDYYAAGRTRLDWVQAYYKNDTVVGYKVQYSEKAWYVGDCDFNGQHSSLKECTEGRISEVSYVSPDFKTYFTDEDRYAEFAFRQD